MTQKNTKAARRKAAKPKAAKPKAPAEEPQEVEGQLPPMSTDPQPFVIDEPTPFGSEELVVVPADGTLLRMDGAPSVFVMRDGKRRPFANPEAFIACGFGWNEIVVLPPAEIVPIPVGPEVVRARDL